MPCIKSTVYQKNENSVTLVDFNEPWRRVLDVTQYILHKHILDKY